MVSLVVGHLVVSLVVSLVGDLVGDLVVSLVGHLVVSLVGDLVVTLLHVCIFCMFVVSLTSAEGVSAGGPTCVLLYLTATRCPRRN